jgi:hypothetical protein
VIDIVDIANDCCCHVPIEVDDALLYTYLSGFCSLFSSAFRYPGARLQVESFSIVSAPM